ncbi:uncharacterized protein LOC126108785 [Schistocerca cancellata]|uniref:uncharacterized protein LOC126108785 n=1 Tax=Schistocerca cancellata TaxID=274614 RepID=UPI00211771C5|nr:uncharacterized protein LOC126108785 [Schistocerca cancellata]
MGKIGLYSSHVVDTMQLIGRVLRLPFSKQKIYKLSVCLAITDNIIIDLMSCTWFIIKYLLASHYNYHTFWRQQYEDLMQVGCQLSIGIWLLLLFLVHQIFH